jgi:hypothetical protein
MSNNIKVEEVATIKQPQFKAGKHAHLYEVFNDYNECEKNRQLLRGVEACEGLQYINDGSGDYIQSILWLDDCVDMWNDLQDSIDMHVNFDGQPQEAIEKYKLQQAIINHLSVFMVENDLDFIFI